MPKPRKPERRLGEDAGAHQQRRADDDRADGVGQDVLEDDATIGGAGDAGGVDELALAKGKELGPHEAGEAGPREQPQNEGDAPDAGGAETVAGDRGDEQERDHEDDVREAHQRRVHPPPVVPGEGSDHDADRDGEGGQHEDHDERLLHAAHRQREHVAGLLVVEAERVVADRDAGTAEPRRPQRHRRACSGFGGTTVL